MPRAKKPAGSKLEPVTVRIDPRDKWLLELMSRALHKPISSVFSWSLEVGARLTDSPASEDASRMSVLDVAHGSWDADELHRVLTLAYMAPSLLNQDESAMVIAIRSSPELRRPPPDSPELPFDPWSNLSLFVHANRDLLTKHLRAFKKLALTSVSTSPVQKITKAKLIAASAALANEE